MLPDGETINALQDELYDRLAHYRAPTTAEVDSFHDRLARYRTDGNDAVKQPRIELERLDGGTLPYALRSGGDTPQTSDVRNDIDFDPSPIFTPGAQVAQIAPPINPGASTAGIAGATQQPYGVTPEAAKAGRQIDKWFDEKVNLLSLPWQMYQGLTNDASPATPSQSLDPEIESGSKTPPLKPDSRLPSIPPSMKQEDVTAIEEFIRHEGKDWIEGFSSLDQKFIRDLMIQQIHHHGMLGKPETRETDLKVAKMMTEIRNAEYPELTGLFHHLYGSYFEGNKDSSDNPMKQEVIPNGPYSRIYPDITFGHPTDDEVRGRINTISGNMREIASGVEYFKPTTDEKISLQAMLESMAGGVAQTIPKTWKLNDDALWNQYAETACRMVLEGIKTKLLEKGYLKQPDERPELPE